MRSLAFVVCLFGSAVCQHWGHLEQVGDTPEVAAAKSAHLAALSKAHQQSSGPADDGSYRPEHHESWNSDGSWNSDRSWAQTGGDSSGDDGSYRPEHHESRNNDGWNADRSWARQGSDRDGDDGSYRPEHHNGPWNDDHSSPHWSQPPQWTHTDTHRHRDGPQKKWTGPIALPPGFDKNGAPLPVHDTPEVTAEKSKHFHLYAHGAHAAAAAQHH